MVEPNRIYRVLQYPNQYLIKNKKQPHITINSACHHDDMTSHMHAVFTGFADVVREEGCKGWRGGGGGGGGEQDGTKPTDNQTRRDKEM